MIYGVRVMAVISQVFIIIRWQLGVKGYVRQEWTLSQVFPK